MELMVFKGDVPEAVLDALVEIYIECFTGPPRFETWSPEDVRSHINQFIESGADCFVITEDKEVVAFSIGIEMKNYFNKEMLIEQGADESSYYFAELGTKTKFRGRGYGTLLQQAREEEARKKGLKLLSVRVRKDNEAVIRLLERRGFEQVGEYTASIQGSETVRLVLQKNLES